MVYNGTSSGLNASLWALYFALPTVGSTFWPVERGTLLADQYIGGGGLLNFMLSEELISFCGLDITNVRTEG